MAGLSFPVSVVISAVDRFSAPLGKMSGATTKWAKDLKAVGKGLTVGVTLPLVALETTAAVTGLGVEKSLNVVQARTRATAEEMAALSSEVDKLGDAPNTITRAATAAELLARKGESLAETTDLLPSVLAIANVAQLELSDSVEVTTDVLEAYGLATSDAARVTDLLAVASERTDLGTLAEGLQAVGTRARTMGQPLETSIALLSELGQVNLEGEAGAKAYGRALEALRKPSKDATLVLHRLGVARSEVFAEDGRPRDLLDILGALERRGAKATDVYRIFGKTAGPGMAALLERGTASARAFRDELDQGAGRALEIQEGQLAGAAGGLARFAAGWDRLKVSIARSGLLEFLGEAAEKVGDFVAWLGRLDPRILKAASIVGLLAAALGPVLVVVGGVATALGGLAAIATALSVPLLALVGIAAGAVAAVGLFLAASYKLLKNWSTIKRVAGDVWDFVRAKVGGAVEWISTKLSTLSSVVPDWLASLLGNTGVGQLAGAISGAVAPSPAMAPRAARASAAVPAGAEVGGRIQVDFSNVPRGTKIASSAAGDVPLDVSAGFNMGGGI